jgi:hypothetical protein
MQNPTYKRTLFLIISILVLIVIAIKLVRATDPHWSLGEWENAHDWRKHGKCLECHSQPQGTTMRPPDYHTAPFRNYTHGRTVALTPTRCYSCHEIQTCQTCHHQKPASHTDSFINPAARSNDEKGLTRHLLMGRLRPSSCLICHQSFVSTCTPCHTPAEVTVWEKRALTELAPWNNLLYAHP